MKYTPDVYFVFSDELIDKIRSGTLSSHGKLRLSFSENSEFHLLRLPFHPNTICLENREWVISVLNCMDVELEMLCTKIHTCKKSDVSHNVYNTQTLYD